LPSGIAPNNELAEEAIAHFTLLEAMSTEPAAKRDLQSFANDLKALMRKRDGIATRWMLAILVLYFLALLAELWVMVGRK
jgi:hypothetical protein